MKLAVSNIAWHPQEEQEIAELLQKMGVKYLEIAPTKMATIPIDLSPDQITDYIKFWEGFGIKIVAFQSMLFNRPDLSIFTSSELRNETLNYLTEFIKLGKKFDISAMVFGSPKNRQIGDLSKDTADRLAIEFFNSIGDEAKHADLYFCIEPNAPQYGCDYIINTAEGFELVTKINNPAVGLHLDTGCMSLAGDNFNDSILKSRSILKHFHISSPMLDQVEQRPDVDHEEAADALRSIDYEGYVSIEMKPLELGLNKARVEEAVAFAKNIYSS